MKTEEEVQKLLSVPSDHRDPIEEKTKLDNKCRWFEQFIKEAKARNSNSNSKSKLISETYKPLTSSQQPFEEDENIHKKSKNSRIPIRSNSNVSLLSDLSSGSSSVFSNSNSRIPTPILTRKNLNFFNNNLEVEIKKQTAKIIKIYEINKDKRWVLISPDHRFVNQCRPKTTPALTYREHDKIRVEHLSKKEIKILEQMQIEDNTEKNGIEIRFLGKK